MTNQIVNAAPMVVDLATQDLSTRLLPRVPEDIPQHLPKYYLYTQKGPTDPQLVVGVERDNMFGSASFDYLGKYVNHSTVFANLVNAEGNSCMIQRVVPDDAGPEANLILWLDVLPTMVEQYLRNSDGSYQLDNLNQKQVTGSPVAGYKVKWVVTNRNALTGTANVGMDHFGQATSMAGNQTDTTVTPSVQSTRYPIAEFKVSSQGEYGNNSGIRIWAPTTASMSAMPTTMMTQNKAFPYYISVVRRPDAFSAASIVESLFGDQRLMFTFKEGVIDPLTDKQLYLGDTFVDTYNNLTDLRYPKVYGDFNQLHIYTDNITTVTQLFQQAEVPFIGLNNAPADFTDSLDDCQLFNFVSGVNSFNAPYYSYVFDNSSPSVTLSNNSNIYAAGGADGTMSFDAHASLVSAQALRYLDPNDEVQDLAVNVESIMYDTGFPIQTKKDLCSIIANRKDTFVVLGTHAVNGVVQDASEEHSIAIALRTHLQNYPESDYFGTPVMRGMIVGRSGKIRNSLYKGYLPLTAEVAVKSARYMGAGNGRWKNGFHFDGAPGSVVDTMYDINITWVPVSVRNKNWDVGLNWVQSYDRRSYFFPALKTVYNNDTSVLNSYFTAIAICQLNKIAHAAWREFTGVSHLTNAQLVANVNSFVNTKTINRFDQRFVIVPDAFFTDMDNIRGFSWTLPIKIYAPNMKTVMTTYVQAYRIDDLATPAA